MLDAVVVCPHPPLLLRELCGAQDAVPDLRAACAEGLAGALAGPPGSGAPTVVVVGGAGTAGSWDPALPDRTSDFGMTGPRTASSPVPELPLSLTVGRRLVREAGWDGPLHLRSVSWDADGDEVAATGRDLVALSLVPDAERTDVATAGVARVVLVVMADGGARRGDKAPGYLDERAFGFDTAIEEALRTGDAATLRDLDRGLSRQLMVCGRPAYAVLGSTVCQTGLQARGELLYSDDPYGVQYTVARWRLTRPADPGR
jgi:hypothetical protein